ncbi:MAG: DUF3631 domain-containing protein [Myxococcales bacterium]|nr:DUF3631 domain-containing protein [Myxococcales bacterium]
MEAAGLRGLTQLSGIADIAAAVTRLGALAGGLDDLGRALLREHAADALRAVRVKNAAKLVDAGLARAAVPSTVASEGGGVAAVVSLPEPWPEPVNGAEVLDDLVKAVRRHVVLGEHEAVAAALFALHTYCLDAAHISPRLAVLSPTKRCGKSTLLNLLATVVAKPLLVANITAAALFRIVDAVQPTLVIDEADSFMAGKEELRNVLNAGHDRETARVLRCAGKEDGFAPLVFSAWAPVVIGAIGELPGTLADRSITIRMRRKGPSDRVAPLRRRERAALAPLAQRCARWAADNLTTLGDAAAPELSLDSDRAADNWEALVCIARLAGGDEWHARAVVAAQALSSKAATEEGGTELGERLLSDIRGLFESRAVGDRVSMQELATALAGLDGSPWGEVSRGKPITTNYLGKRLSPFGVRAKPIRFPDKTRKGFEYSAFDDAFARYLPAQAVAPVTGTDSQANSLGDSGLPDVRVTGAQEAPLGCHSEGVTDVTAWAPEPADLAFEERAAILEYDAGLSRAEAERRAREELLDA